MKVIASLTIMAIIVGGFTYYFLSQSPEIIEESDHANIEEVNQIQPETKEIKETYPEKSEAPLLRQNRITNKNKDFKEEDKDEQFEPEFEDDYSEPVEIEDFKEFVDNALEELEEDEEVAVAIIMEMSKIVKAQPKLEDEAIRFYKQCADSTRLSNNIKSHCIGALKERGF